MRTRRAPTRRFSNGGGAVADALVGFHTLLGPSDLLAYLSMMAPRLVELRRVLKPNGSIFLHCDPTAGHYLKVLMDSIFGPKAFRNEIVWCYTGPGSPGIRQFLRKHDTIFWYAKGPQWKFNADAVRVAHSDKTRANYKPGLEGSGFIGAEHRIHEKGKVPEDWWQIAIAPRGREYMGYPTQKPEKLLERIILAASDEGDVVLDPFCGCGTAVAVAQRLKRRWIGIDITHLAIGLVRRRLIDAFGEEIIKTFRVIGEPTDLEGAKELARSDPYQFQFWILGLVGARPAEEKKGADKGIDGRIYFHDEMGAGAKTKQVVLSVKAGKLHAPYVRDLRGVMDREKAEFGVLLSMEEPTKAMRSEAASAGFYETYPGSTRSVKYPRLQIITVEELLQGHGIDYPGRIGSTFRQAPRAKDSAYPEPESLFAAETAPEYPAD